MSLLVVGHADLVGKHSYNDVLSLERAESVAAYLRDDVDAWYRWYSSGKQRSKRWGNEEDELMIEAIADDCGEEIPARVSLVRWYQERGDLQVDGIAGKQTRSALIVEYMDLDGTTVSPETNVVAHGCGEHYPAIDTPNGVADDANRRVEIFLFEQPLAPPDESIGVLPPPPGDNSSASATEYPTWVIRARETKDFKVGRWIRFIVRFDDGSPATNVPVRIRQDDGVELSGTSNARGVATILGASTEQFEIIKIEHPSTVESFE